MAYIQLQFRRDTAANWTSVNPTLASGEMGLETDSAQFKIGDGATAWTALDYVGNVGPAGPAGADGADGADGAPGAPGADGADGADGVGIPVGGTTGQALIKNSNDDYDTEWGTVASSPGGSDTQVQFNDGGSFGGDAGLTFNKTSKAITLGGATVTASSPVIDAAQTWNDGAVTFTGLKFNATDTASAAASLLMDLQVGGTSRANVRKDGRIVTALTIPNSATPTMWLSGNAADTGVGATYGVGFVVSGTMRVYASANGLYSNVNYNTTGNYVLGSGEDLILSRRGAANLRFGAADAAAPVAQTLSVQSVVAGTTNTAGANLTITGSQGTGTGAGGSIIFQVAPAGSTGTAQNALAAALTLTSAKEVKCAGPLWVSNAYTGGAPTPTGYIVLYDSTGTAYKIPAEAV